jgi:hypothetical protein
MTTAETIYNTLLNTKRTWTPVAMTAGALAPGASEVIHRALSLRFLELPVGEFITEACRRDIPEASRVLLQSNVVDEERHDKALNFAADAHPDTHQFTDTADQFVEAVVSHPDHTVLKAMVLERSIFFVLLPMFRFLGDAGLRTVSADISRDERVHVAANSLVCAELGLTCSPTLDKLRRDIIEWVVSPLMADHPENRYLSRSFWVDQSDHLLYTGKAPGFDETRRARMPAFFEHNNQNLPQYA